MIVTVTLNPAVDEEYLLPQLAMGHWTRAVSSQRSPGGRGINAAVTLSRLGYETAAMGYLAGYNGDYISNELRRLKVATSFVHVSGETRTNVYLLDNDGDRGTGIAEEGPPIDEEAQKRFMMNYRRMINRADAVILGGSLPLGVPRDVYRTLAAVAAESSTPVFIDADGTPFLMSLESKPSFARIPEDMIEKLSGKPLDSLDSLIAAALRVQAMGVPWVAASYHVYGNLFATPEGLYLGSFDGSDGMAQSRSLFTLSDALMAGMAAAHVEDMTVTNSIRFAMACAMESSSHKLKGPGGRDAVERFLSKIQLQKLD